ncbi:hypothetical protein JHS3_28490 [Jeongeupia sp. HS-3]|uniref:Flp family type IVb pilin n=1 Tax=Jeongeupia sp. HS-3 TaxID=1009682 RepID=UPI0018A3891F|nr:Flp family type IVb pilin [Jeongeupia sp. HS-3]BCL77113.1 hypothetical protein JHS3_28490 [Jeongeupia sp. HS-3]
MKLPIALPKRQRGATAIEYALVAALIAVVIAVTAEALGGQISTIFTNIRTALINA